MPALVDDPGNIRLAMLGMVEGNGHPYSWSAMFNGYDPEVMADCPYPVIPEYLGKEPPKTIPIEGAHVTHIWTDDLSDAAHVSKASLIPNVVDEAEDVIGEVDAVIVATDIGAEHVDRCRPFVEAGLPIFVDKPLVDNAEDLATFKQWRSRGAHIMSSSSMRYSKEFMPYRISTSNLGALRYVTISMVKTWERYGIHALEAVYPIVGPGFVSARNTGDVDRNIVHFTHERGVDVVIATIADLYGGFGALQICGTEGFDQLKSMDTFYAFKTQLKTFVDYLRTGKLPFPFAETEELMRMVIAGIISREESGREVALDEIEA